MDFGETYHKVLCVWKLSHRIVNIIYTNWWNHHLGSFWYWKLEVTKSLLLSEILINLVTDALGIKSKYMTFSSLTPPVASLMIWTNKFFRIHLLCRFRINLFKLCSSMNRLRHSHFFFLFNLFLQILL